MTVPDVTVATFMMAEFVGDLVGYGEVQVDDAVAAIDAYLWQGHIIGAGMVVLKTEAVCVVDARLTLPAAAVVNGDVIGRTRGDVKEQRVKTCRIRRVGLHSGKNGVVMYQHIVEAMA